MSSTLCSKKIMLYFNETMILLTHTVMQTTYIQTESGCSIPFWISGKIQTNIFPYGNKSLNPFLLKQFHMKSRAD